MNGKNGTGSDNAAYFDSFGVEHITKKSKNSQETKIQQIFTEYSTLFQYLNIEYIQFDNVWILLYWMY